MYYKLTTLNYQNFGKDKKMTKILSFLLILFLFFSCTSPNKSNKEENSSLDYEVFIPELSDKLNEISGLIIYDNLFWGINDSGGKGKIYGFNKLGKIEKTIEFKNAKNRDWEAITQDEKNIYIGDFGNNMGGRKNLRIYKIKKKDIENEKEQKLEAKKISFNYASQSKFTFFSKTTPFDCESMVEFKGDLYIFSKNWRDRTTTVYRIPAKKGEYEIHPTDTFDVDMLITGADISPDKSKLVLLGYENYQSYMWVFSNFQDDNFFKGDSNCYILNKLRNTQTEGICFYNNEAVLVSCERTKSFKQQVFLFKLPKTKNGAH